MQVQDDKLYDDINVTPMLDLAYVLLVIFIIMTTASVQGIKVNLPKASATPSLAKPTTKAITITDAGQIFLDTYPVTMSELESQLRSHKAVNPSFPVVIKGDAKGWLAGPVIADGVANGHDPGTEDVRRPGAGTDEVGQRG